MQAPKPLARVLAAIGAAILSLPLTPTSARAQNLPLAQLLPDLVLRDIVLQPGIAGPPHQAHFTPLANEPNNPVVAIVDGFNTQMATQFATFPLGSSSGGMTYVFDESVGTFRRGSSSFGPLFAERALTIGRRKLSVGFNYQHTSYDTFEGRNLDDGSIKFYLRHNDCCTFRLLPQAPFQEFSGQRGDGSRLTPPFEGDLIEAALTLKATTQTTAVFANYGATDRWDVGVAVPFVRVDLEASVLARILRLVTCPVPVPVPECANIHTFEAGNPNATETVQRSGHAAGLGDIVLRTKYHFLRAAGGGGLAAAVDLRLPTGDKNELLGAGGTEAKVLLVASRERGHIGQHMNIGYTTAHGTVVGTPGLNAASLPDEINYTGGIELVASPRLTLMGDVVGRTLRRAGRLEVVSKPFEYSTGLAGVGLPLDSTPQQVVAAGILSFKTATISLDEFDPRPSNLTLLLGTGGVKFNLAGNLLISGSVLFPLTKAGLRSRVTTVVGLDYAF